MSRDVILAFSGIPVANPDAVLIAYLLLCFWPAIAFALVFGLQAAIQFIAAALKAGE